MNNFFTIISIVMAVSGSTYTTIIAIRNWLGDGVKDAIANAAQCLEEAENADLKNVTSSCKECEGKLSCWKNIWRWTYAVPIILFALTAYGMAIHALIEYWDNGAVNGKAWDVYKYLLVLLLIVDGVCIMATFVARWRICAEVITMQKHLKTENEHQGKKLLPTGGQSKIILPPES